MEEAVAVSASVPRHEPLQPGAVAPWLREGARAALGQPPRWSGLQAHPMVVLALVALQCLLAVLLQRLYIPGPARFYGAAVLCGWVATAAMAWVSQLLRVPSQAQPGGPPSATHLFCLLAAQALAVSAACGGVFVALVHAGAGAWLGGGGWMALTLACWGWLALVQLVLLNRSAPGRPLAALGGALVLLAASLGVQWWQPARFWYPDMPADELPPEPQLRLDQTTMEAQPRLLAERLEALQPGRPGVVDLYAITFAPYAEEDVFSRESEMVASVMAQRFDAAGRSLQLVNHVDTLAQWPWATPLNLQRSIRRIAQRMNRDEDVLFIHLTSHGARNGQLAASFPPMAVDEVTPQQLKAWLDEAGIRWRVISISACFSGSWIAPLAGEGTLVMTAADADHTSYGCGRRSPLTFFGRAMYDEQLRGQTRSFEQAHAAVRPVIEQREKEAGKSDGYSNPQISVGAAVREPLRRLEARLHGHGGALTTIPRFPEGSAQ
ncbi:C13 family peptidase [Ideonella sp. BN130291]|uniref:C13 family peptidase n=1 Tax=Ideonella sp. BN130291 TaxID=3112940 RepID=UPI002E273344|nr:C13 family peptidase [Ideonella sp. BN130291]